MWARKRGTGRVEHWWINPYPGQKDVWQAQCLVNITTNPERGIVKVSKDEYFVKHPSGASRCRSCLKRIAKI